MTKPMTRAEMKRAAFAVMETSIFGTMVGDFSSAAQMCDVDVVEINAENGRFSWHLGGYHLDKFANEFGVVEASMLLSEAHRPRGHNGDGKDD